MKVHSKTSKLYFFICFLFLIAVVVRPAQLIYQQRENFFSPGYNKQYESLKSSYYNSQYVKKKNPYIMPDEVFESFVGGAFIRGVNPILIVHEHPPLGRYIIGFSTLLFDNAATLIIPLSLISVIGIFLISKLVFKKTILSIIPLLIFTNEPLFLSKFKYAPLLEAIQLPFVILCIYFFIKGVSSKKSLYWFIVSSIMLGFVISIRFFILGLAISSSMILFFILRRRIDRKFIMYILSLPFSVLVLILSYTRTIQDGYSFFQVFSIQKYILYYHKSKLISFFSFWDLIFFNRWHTWWGDKKILSDSAWFIIWPISMILTFLFLLFVLRKKMTFSVPEKIIFLWIFVYSLLLSVGNSTTRYFLPLVPFLYILSVSFLIKLFKKTKA